MEKEFIPYEQALALKELGFDSNVFKSYDTSVVNLDGKFLLDYYYNVRSVDEVKAPLYQQAFRWFREKYKFEFHIECYRHTSVKYYQVHLDDVLSKHSYSLGKSFTYKEAELKCLKKLISIIKESKNGNN